MRNKLSFHQSSVSLEIIGLPDYSNNENNDQIIIKSLLTISLCISDKGNQKLKKFLLDF